MPDSHSLALDQLRVELGDRSYDILIGTDVLRTCCTRVAQQLGMMHAVVMTDDQVETPHAVNVADCLSDAGVAVDLMVVDAGEASKSVQTAERLWQQLLETNTDRQSVILAVGGGVVGDLAGFVAATYARGLQFVQVPTTLLAQVDSSVGGKVAINLPTAKNMIGAFWQPAAVLIDTRVLSTLPPRDYRAGWGEVVKYAVIQDAEFFCYLEQHVEGILSRDDAVLRHVVARCCRYKAEIVQEDEREQSGRRAILNYGHTFGHALEAATGYEMLLHGEAVAIGMLCASRLAESLQLVDRPFTARLRQLLAALGLPVDVPPVDVQRVMAAMQQDKKVARGQIRFVLPVCLGRVELFGGIDDKLVHAALVG
ncbi:MAG: 3-dehydroquinate synthase [Pirellulaceae bacterium]|jgi:3-dehydroquinate synthase|nr:3-dehydroquinate synthase [Pirellulaceae bacterium]